VIEHKGVRLLWNPTERLATFEYNHDTSLTAEAADALIPTFKAWVGASTGPYGILVNAANTVASNDAWRARWAEVHREQQGRARIAIYNASIFIQGFLMLYSHVARTRLQCCNTEAAARAWLHAEGVPVALAPSGA